MVHKHHEGWKAGNEFKKVAGQKYGGTIIVGELRV
jgi:hypothetical protein